MQFLFVGFFFFFHVNILNIKQILFIQFPKKKEFKKIFLFLFIELPLFTTLKIEGALNGFLPFTITRYNLINY